MNVNLLAATQTVEKTMPFVFRRWLIYLGLAFGFIFAALAGAGTAIAVSSFSSDPTFFANFGAVIGFAGFSWLLYKFRRSVANEVSYPHLLLIAKVLHGDPIPSGKSQVTFAKQELAKRFPTVSDRHFLDSKIKGTLTALPKLSGIFLAPKITGRMRTLADRASAWINGRNTDVVFARTVAEESRAVWPAAYLSVVRQAQNASTFLTQRAYLILFELIGSVVSYAVLLVPILKIADALPFSTTFWPYVVAGVFSWNLKASFLEPISQAAMIRLDIGLERTEPGQDLVPALTQSSSAFREIAERAAGSD